MSKTERNSKKQSKQTETDRKIPGNIQKQAKEMGTARPGSKQHMVHCN